MNILVAYAGKTGTTKKCVDYIKMITTNNDVAIYNTALGTNINIDNYDVVIIGGSVRLGTIDTSLKNFMKLNDFTNKTTGIFVVCGAVDKADRMIEDNFGDLYESSKAVSCFGGELSIAKGTNHLERQVYKKAIKDCKKKNKPLPEIDYNAIKEFMVKLIGEIDEHHNMIDF